jgi:hypothetical protein
LFSIEKKYFLILVQDGGVLTPTGGVVEKFILLSSEGGKFTIIDEVEPDTLNRQFKGRVGNSVFPETPFINYDYDKSLLLQDKLIILRKIYSENYDININGIVTIEKQTLNEFISLRDAIRHKDITPAESLVSYTKILPLFDSKNINFIFEEGSELIGSKEILNTEGRLSQPCNFNIRIFEEKENYITNSSTGLKIIGIKEGGSLRLTFNILNINSGESDLFLINIPNGKLENNKKNNLDIFPVDGEEYISLKANKIKASGNIEFIIPLGGCENRFSIFFEKQPGNDGIQLNYDYSTDSEYNLYLDGTLTQWGNKFYNNGSLNLKEDFSLKFVK